MLYVYFALYANLIRRAQSSAVRWRTLSISIRAGLCGGAVSPCGDRVHNYYGPGVIFPGLEDDLFSSPLRKVGRFKPWQPRAQFEYIALPDEIAASFKGGVYVQETLEKDLKVFRTTNKGGAAKGKWWTTKEITDATEARASRCRPGTGPRGWLRA